MRERGVLVMMPHERQLDYVLVANASLPERTNSDLRSFHDIRQVLVTAAIRVFVVCAPENANTDESFSDLDLRVQYLDDQVRDIGQIRCIDLACHRARDAATNYPYWHFTSKRLCPSCRVEWDWRLIWIITLWELACLLQLVHRWVVQTHAVQNFIEKRHQLFFHVVQRQKDFSRIKR